MKYSSLTIQKASAALMLFIFFGCSLAAFAGDLEFSGGVTAEIDYVVDGSLWIYDANVGLYEPAHIRGFVVTGSGAVLDVYGGQIDYMLLISMHDMALPDGVVTVYGTDFAVDGVPVTPDTTELFLQGQMLSGVYENGTSFAFPVDCVIVGGAGFVYYQTVKLGWITSQPDIELSHDEYDFGQTYVTETKTGTVTIYNLGNAALTVQSLSIEGDDHGEFSIPWTPLPFTVDPNAGVDVEVLYTPVAEGTSEGTFKIFSDDPNDPYVSVHLIGQGVPLPPEQQIQNILDAYDAAFADGSVQGVGNDKSGANKVETFGKMLLVVDELIDAGYYDYALDVLLSIEAKCDGEKAPKDFIEGQGVAGLNELINQLIQALQIQ